MRSTFKLARLAVLLTLPACAPTATDLELSRDHPANPEAPTAPFEDTTPDLGKRENPEPTPANTPSAHGGNAPESDHEH